MSGAPARPPATRPCGSCPYRRDVPSGVWEAEEYAKLPPYDAETGAQPPGLFLCHQQDGRVCAGWAGCHDMRHALAVRIAGLKDPMLALALTLYRTETPLFASGAEAAAHGLAEVAEPGPAAERVMEKLRRRRGR